MTKIRRSLPFLALVVLATSLPALAETFTVVLKNGSQFETRYRPTVAHWDESKLLLVTATCFPSASSTSLALGSLRTRSRHSGQSGTFRSPS